MQKEYLPEDYGGSLPKMDYSSKEWYPVLRSIDDFIRGKPGTGCCLQPVAAPLNLLSLLPENNTFGLVTK